MENKRMNKGHKHKLVWLGLIVLLVCVILGSLYVYHKKRSTAPRRIICIPKIIDQENDFWVQLLEGVKMAGLEYGMEVEIVAAGREDAFEEQNQLIYWAIEQKPSAIILVPSSLSDTAQAAAAVEQSGIPLILMDSEVENRGDVPLVATDNVEAGRIQGQFMAGLLDKDSKIALVAHVKGSSTALDREQGVREGLGEYASNIVDVVYCDSDYDKAYELMNQILDRYPDLDMVAGLNEYSAVGAARAVVNRGLQGQVRLVGFDSSLEEIRLLEQGIFEGIVIQNPYKMGYLAVEAANQALKGEKVKVDIDSGAKLITREKMFTDENQKLLFMFSED